MSLRRALRAGVDEQLPILPIRHRRSRLERLIAGVRCEERFVKYQRRILEPGLDIAQQESLVAQQRASVPPLDQQLRQNIATLAVLLGEAPERLNVRGGSLSNAIVVDGDRILNEEGLRHDNEFVRHRALDAVGDLYLTGHPIIGHFIGRCSSHADTARLMRQVYADRSCWEMVDMWQEPALSPWLDQAAPVAFVGRPDKARRAATAR